MTVPVGTGRVVALAVGQFCTTLAGGLAAGLSKTVAAIASAGSTGLTLYAHFQTPPGAAVSDPLTLKNEKQPTASGSL